jgi:glycosyltransferase involved in cell wall biosynthesis
MPPGDANALGEALSRLLSDDALRASLGQAGRARVTRDFSAEAMIERTLAVYDEVLAGSGRVGLAPELLQ